jgi:hypothetical protein
MLVISAILPLYSYYCIASPYITPPNAITLARRAYRPSRTPSKLPKRANYRSAFPRPSTRRITIVICKPIVQQASSSSSLACTDRVVCSQDLQNRHALGPARHTFVPAYTPSKRLIVPARPQESRNQKDGVQYRGESTFVLLLLMPMSRGPALLQHISSNKVPLPMPCTNPCRAIHRSPPAARARPWPLICQAGGGQAQAGSGLRLRRHFCSFVWPAEGLPSPVTHDDVTSLSFPPPSYPLPPLSRSWSSVASSHV